MKKALFYGLLLFLVTGCSAGKYQIPKQDYQAKVQVLGVMPLLVDPALPFEYPQQEALLDLVKRTATGKHELLVEQLRSKKGYFDVRPLDGDPALLGLSVLSGEKSYAVDGRPAGYQFNAEAVAELTRRNVVDGLLVVIISGAKVKETRRSRTLLESLTTEYNDIMAMAAVVDRHGEVLWQLSGADAANILQLQYADFDEAFYNKTELVQIKNIGFAGVEKSLQAKGGGLPEVYDKLFGRIVTGISPGLLNSL